MKSKPCLFILGNETRVHLGEIGWRLTRAQYGHVELEDDDVDGLVRLKDHLSFFSSLKKQIN